MPTVTSVTTQGSTVDGTSVTTASYSAARGDLFVMFVLITDCASDAPPILTNSIQGVAGWSFLTKATWRTSLDSLYVFIANAFDTGPGLRTTTINCAPVTATGFGYSVWRVGGLSRVGLSAVRQVAPSVNNHASGSPPVTVLPLAPLAGGVVFAGASSSTAGSIGSNPPNPPFGNVSQASFATPTTSFAFAGASPPVAPSATFTWAGNVSTEFCAVALELDIRPLTADDVPQQVAGWGSIR